MASFAQLASNHLAVDLYLQPIFDACDSEPVAREPGTALPQCSTIGLPLVDLTSESGICRCPSAENAPAINANICRVVGAKYQHKIIEFCDSDVYVYVSAVGVNESICGIPAAEIVRVSVPDVANVPFARISWGSSLLEVKGLKGGVSIENVSFNPTSGKICADVRVWAKASYLGQTVKFDERRNVCISLYEPCYTFWENSWASAKVCYEHPWKICGVLEVDIWVYEDEWKQCYNVPHGEHLICQTAPPSVEDSPCGCK